MRKIIVALSHIGVVMGGGVPTATISLGRSVVKFTGSTHVVLGEPIAATAKTFRRDGSTRTVYTITGNFTESEVVLSEFQYDPGAGNTYDEKIVCVLWPAIVDGVEYWAPPEWLLGSAHANPLPTQLLQDVGPEYWLDGPEMSICRLTGGSSVGLRAYRLSGNASINSKFADSNFVGHANADAAYFIPTVAKRMLDTRPSATVYAPPPTPDAPAIPASSDVGDKQDLSALETRLVSIQLTQIAILERLEMMATAEDNAVFWSHNFNNLQVLNNNVKTVGDATAASVVPQTQRIAETAAVSLGVRLLVG